MVLKRSVITTRLQELDTVLQELAQYRHITAVELQNDLSRRWIIERGLIAAASLILDMANHILSGHFGQYPDTYEESLTGLETEKVIPTVLYQELKGLGDFRNVLVHLYQEIDPQQVWESYQKGMTVFPRFAQAILVWLDSLEDT
jgi:uncharacterized protein YutE (UPF0331/DUF86 family)